MKNYLERAIEISTNSENCQDDNWGDWVNLCGEADAEIKGMREALERYGSHTTQCGMNQVFVGGGGSCICGLKEALKKGKP